MRNKHLYFLFFVMSSKLILAQTASIGIQSGWDIFIFDRGNSLGTNLNLSFNYSFNKLFEIEVKSGLSIAEDFTGFDFGGYLKLYPIEFPIYVIGGMKIHPNIGHSGNGQGVRDDVYYLPTLGLGYKIKVSKTFITYEIIYQKPYPNGLNWFYSVDQYYYSDDFYGVIGFNFIFSWEL